MSAARLRAIARAGAMPLAALGFLVAGAMLHFARPGTTFDATAWYAGLVLIGAPLVWRTVAGMVRGNFASDVVAMLAIVTAIVVGEPLAGLVIVLMQTGGEALEHYAEGRASNAVRELEAAAPRIAHRYDGDHVTDVTVEQVAVGDRLIVRPGEMFPCDSVVVEGASDVDVSRLTGEPIPVCARAGTELPSGALNGEGPLTVRALKPSRESLYARIVELVRSAQASKAPLQRLADRYAVWFTPITIVACAVAYAITRDWTRVLAVLVVATPCPLILATPVAIIGGINRAARRQIIVRTGAALEQLARVRVAVFDKTGTLTVGRPMVSRVDAEEPFDAPGLLRLAGAVEIQSAHLLARSLVEAAVRGGDALPTATAVLESPGRGVEGTVAGRHVAVGSAAWIAERFPAAGAAVAGRAAASDGLRAFVAIDGAFAGVVEYADAARPGAREVLARLTAGGIRRTILLSGDHAQNAEKIAAELGITEVMGDLLPDDKTRVVSDLVARGEQVLMVGDGTNDAPALTAASVGIALAGHGGGITAEAADAVVLIDDLGRVADAVAIGQRTIRIAQQSIRVGLLLSGTAMVVAAAGFLPPVIGALVQEAIDVAVILNALRTSRDGV